MVYGALGFPNFAHVEFATLGAYLALALTSTMKLGLVPAALMALAVAGLCGILADRLIFKRLRKATAIMLMIASFGLGIALRESIRAAWGTSPHFYPLELQRPFTLLGAAITPIQIGIVVAALACMLGFHLLLNRTKLGIAMRATADNPRLAEASGINTEKIISMVWFIGCAFAALGGVLIGMETQIHPNMGFAIIIPVFCAAILGGIGNPYGAVIGAGLVAFAQNIGLGINWAPLASLAGLTTKSYLFIPTGYKEAIPFALLIVILLLRPQGIMGGSNA
jgi:branched-subunit amino acid ABC-type transport system permease component